MKIGIDKIERNESNIVDWLMLADKIMEAFRVSDTRPLANSWQTSDGIILNVL